jgi:hypothetical protein
LVWTPAFQNTSVTTRACSPPTLDSSKYKTFEVVHGETITSSGVGDVELLVATTQGKPRVLTLRNVYYIPLQNMSLISVDKAISGQGFDSTRRST